ncbi:MAG: hypothetical protein A2178_01170 [Planctomycetes bacterium GWC2_49_10]|nr:MAG: hypothetical protein A2178_01170 [Planctomycetes bacterium GWC2_49_10]
MQGAKTLLSLYGYAATTIDDVITAAGITKGAFYHYFKSKEALCQAAIEHAESEYLQLTQSIPSDITAYEKLRLLLDSLTQLNSSGRWINCRMMLKLMTEPHDESPLLQNQLTEFHNWYRGFYYDLITQCRTDGSIPHTLDDQSQTSLVMAMMIGLCMLNQMDPPAQPAGSPAEHILRLLK